MRTKYLWIPLLVLPVILFAFQNCGKGFSSQQIDQISSTLSSGSSSTGSTDPNAATGSGGTTTVNGTPVGTLTAGSTSTAMTTVPKTIYKQVATGYDHICVLTEQNTVMCIGSNSSGQLGNNSTTNSILPVLVSGLQGVKQIATGPSFTCVITAQDTVSCWGSIAKSLVPVAISGLQGVKQIAAGGAHVCVVTAQNLYCWGDNSYGQLGNNSITASTTPVIVSGLQAVKQVTTGDSHTCAITAQDTMACWGYNYAGQLGNGTYTDSHIPVAIQSLQNVTQISVGHGVTCALAGQGGDLYCWGDNGLVPSTSSKAVPQLQNQQGVKQIAIGGGVCIITAQDTVNCFGIGYNSTPKPAVPVAGLQGITQITSIGSTYCAIAAQGGVYCWGSNSQNQLGNNMVSGSLTPTPVSAAFQGAKQLAPGDFSSCALDAQNSVLCWSGSSTLSATPTAVAGLQGAKQIATGDRHSCAITAQDTVSCWGQNDSGQLGNNSTTTSSTPVTALGLQGVKQIAAKGVSTCVITAQDTVSCWGGNSYGALGQKPDPKSLLPYIGVPTTVPGLSGVKQIALGWLYACAITAQNRVMCWGENDLGQLGNNSTTASYIPVTVAGLQNVVQISSSNEHVCAVTAQGFAYCWGKNSSGQLGNASTAAISTVPVLVQGLQGVTQIFAGDNNIASLGIYDYPNSCAVTTQGAAYCWGANRWSELGSTAISQSSVPVLIQSSNVSAILAAGPATVFRTNANVTAVLGRIYASTSVPVEVF